MCIWGCGCDRGVSGMWMWQRCAWDVGVAEVCLGCGCGRGVPGGCGCGRGVSGCVGVAGVHGCGCVSL